MGKIKLFFVVVFTLLIGIAIGFNTASSFGEIDIFSEKISKSVILNEDKLFYDHSGNLIEVKKGTVINFDKRYDFQKFYSLRLVVEGDIETKDYGFGGPKYYFADETTKN